MTDQKPASIEAIDEVRRALGPRAEAPQRLSSNFASLSAEQRALIAECLSNFDDAGDTSGRYAPDKEEVRPSIKLPPLSAEERRAKKAEINEIFDECAYGYDDANDTSGRYEPEPVEKGPAPRI